MFIILLKEGESVMGDLKTYGDIYDEEFLEKFGKYRKDVANTKLEKEFEVDVNKIAELCEIVVSYKKLDVSGTCMNFHSSANEERSEYNTDSGIRTIYVNILDPEFRQRFTIAHEIGHIILDHEGISHRDTSYTVYKGIIERMNEVSANSFAAELLMPEQLLREALLDTMTKLDYNAEGKFSESDIDYIAVNTASKMNVSLESFKYRLKNLNIFR